MIQAGSRFAVAFVGLVDSNGAVVNTEAHLHITNADGSQTRLTRSGGEITYSQPATDPETGLDAVNKYEALLQHAVPGNYRAQWHFPDIGFAAKPRLYPIAGPSLVEPA